MTPARRARAHLHRMAGFFLRRRREREMAEEFESHLQLHIDENLRAGMSPEAARRDAMLKFGPVEAIKESYRDQSRLPRIDAALRDVKYAVRILRRHPAFSAAAIATLALGMAAGAAVFSIVDAVFLRPLPYPDPARVVGVKGSQGQTFADFVPRIDLKARYRSTRSFGALGLYAAGGLNFGGEPAARINAAAVTPGFFGALGAHPLVGRAFTDDDLTHASRVAVVSHVFWRTRMGGRDDVAGSRITLNGRDYEVLGVMPAGVSFPDRTQVWIPTDADSQLLGNVPAFTLVGRLRDGVSPPEARTELLTLAKTTGPWADKLAVVPLHDALVGELRPVAGLVSAGATLVLLIACINTANLLLARVAARRREFVVRRALGASRAQLVWQVLAESLTLAAVAGAAAIPLAIVTLRFATSLLPETLHGLDAIEMNARAMVVVAGMALVTALFFGLAPAISARDASGSEALRSVSSISMGRFWTRLRSSLLVVEVAVALVLLAGAATLVTTVLGLMRTDVGVRGDRALVLQVTLPRGQYRTPEQANAFHFALRDGIARLGGVEAVGMTNQLPLAASPLLMAATIALEGQPRPRPEGRERPPSAVQLAVSHGYFEAVGIDLVAGRTFRDTDRAGAPRLVIVSESWARAVKLTPRELVGRRAVMSGPHDQEVFPEIVGVVRDVKMRKPDAKFDAAIYHPLSDNSFVLNNAFIVVKGTGDPRMLAPAIRAEASRLDPTLPFFNVRTFDDVRATHFADRRFAMVTMVVFGSVAFLLSMLGLYGVIAYLVQMRTREIGIRIAIGAAPAQVQRQVIASGLGHTAAGLLAGAVLAAGAARVAAGRIAGIPRLEPEVIGTLAAAVLLVAAAAAWIPARRATRIDPLLTLKAE